MGPQGWSAQSEEAKNLLTMQRTEPRFLSCPTQGPVVGRCLLNEKFHLPFTVQTSQPQKNNHYIWCRENISTKIYVYRQLQFSFKFWTDLTSKAHAKSQPMKTINQSSLNIFKHLSKSFFQ
jgi:hypothetical protein